MIRRVLPPLLLTAALAACDQAPGRVGTGEGKGVLVVDVGPEADHQLDILFVIDDSGSMQEQQTALVEAARASLFAQLEQELGYLPDLHVGITSSSAPMPAGTENILGCHGPSVFPRGGRLWPGDCGLDGPPFLIDQDDGAGGRFRNFPGELADAFSCVAQLGTSGCGFEQPLASAVRVAELGPLADSGFLRPDALFLIVIVTDEDDCSAVDPAIFNSPQATLADPIGPRTSFRCFEFGVTCDQAARELGDKTGCVPTTGGYLADLDALADRLRAAKADPSKIMIAGLHGGRDGVTVVPDVDDPSRPMLGTVCNGTDFEVTPAIRLSGFERAFPARWILPGCAESTAAKLARITRAAAGVLGRSTCLLGAAPAISTCTVETVTADGVRTAVAGARIAPDPRCDYTEHQLRVDVPLSAIPAGSRLQVRCDD